MKQILQPFTLFFRSEFWISIFVISYCFLSVVWLLRLSDPRFGQLKSLITPIVILEGIDQNWSLFSPELRNFNLHNVAFITFRNGAVKFYEWPRMDRSDMYAQRHDEKYRKLLIDCLPWNESKDVLPSVARFIARANANPANPPVKVTLGYFWSMIPPPTRGVRQNELPYKTKYSCYFNYRVQPGDVR